MNGGLLIDMPVNIRPPGYGEEISLPDANNNTIPLTAPEENWETVHQDFTALKGDLASMKVRIAEAERERSTMQRDHTVKHPKSKSVLSAFKPEKIFNKFFSSKGFSSSESSQNSESPELAAGKVTIKQLRHSIT